MINFLLTYFKLIDNPKDGYVDYYHYVVGRTPKEKTNTFSDRLIVSAFEDISNQESSGLWTRTDITANELKQQCELCRPFYQVARQRLQSTQQYQQQTQLQDENRPAA